MLLESGFYSKVLEIDKAIDLTESCGTTLLSANDIFHGQTGSHAAGAPNRTVNTEPASFPECQPVTLFPSLHPLIIT